MDERKVQVDRVPQQIRWWDLGTKGPVARRTGCPALVSSRTLALHSNHKHVTRRSLRRLSRTKLSHTRMCRQLVWIVLLAKESKGQALLCLSDPVFPFVPTELSRRRDKRKKMEGERDRTHSTCKSLSCSILMRFQSPGCSSTYRPLTVLTGYNTTTETSASSTNMQCSYKTECSSTGLKRKEQSNEMHKEFVPPDLCESWRLRYEREPGERARWWRRNRSWWAEEE